MATDQELVSTWSDPTERGDEGGLCLGSDSQSSPDQDESEKKTKKPDDEEDGEVSSDEESEEGEIKDGGQDEFMPAPLKHPNKIPGNTGNTQNNQQQKTSICKFFAKGQCTWGMNCRFLHLAPQPVPLPLKVPNQRGHQFQAGLHPTGLHPPGVHPTGLHPAGPTGAHMTGHHQNRAPDYNFMAPPVNRHPPGHLGPPIPPPHHQPPPPPPPPQGTSSNNPESAWERGLRHAKEMIKKASRRKEEEVDFDDKRFNLGVEDETSHSRNSHRSRESPEAPEYDGARVRGGSRSPPLHYKEWSDYKEPMHYRDYHREKDKSAHPREAQDPAQRPSDREREREREREFRERERERERERARRYNSRDDHYNSEYERRRRLAFESAPWNDEQSSLPSQAKPAAGRSAQRPREAAEVYRDPWRRSKSPPSKWPAPNARRVEGSSTSKRSHSMSSISESQSGSDLSDSDSLSGSESFSGSESYTDRSDGSGHSPKQTDRKSNQPHRERLASSGHVRSDSKPISRSGKDHGDPTMKGAPIGDRAQPSNKNRAARGSIDDEVTGIDNSKRKGTDKSIPATSSRPRRDSWSDSDSGSSKTGSSASGSDSEDSDASIPASDKSAQAQRRAGNPMARSKEQPRQPIRSPPLSSDNRKNIRARSNYSPSKERGPAKRMKMSSSNAYPPGREGISKSKHSHERGSSDDQKMGSPPSSDETPKKKLIKMTFKKKHSNLKQDRTLTAQLNGDESDGGGEPHARNSRSPSPCIASKESNLTCSKEVDSIKTSSPPSSQPMKETSLLDDLRKSVKKSPPKNDLNPVASKPRSRDDPTTSRRDDLLKQLELVEAMIQKKKALSKPEIDDDWDVPESYRTP